MHLGKHSRGSGMTGATVRYTTFGTSTPTANKNAVIPMQPWSMGRPHRLYGRSQLSSHHHTAYNQIPTTNAAARFGLDGPLPCPVAGR